MSSEPLTLIVGGLGKTGRRVALRLTALGARWRAASRSSELPFDWEREETWPSVLRGVTAIYLTYYPDLALPGASERIRRLCALAVENAVEQIVLLSGRGEHQVWPSERAVRESGAAFTILRCAWFCQNFDEGHLLDPILDGELALPAGSVSEPFIDADDIADVAVAALDRSQRARHAGQIYDLTGPRLLGFGEAVHEIARVTRRRIRYSPISDTAYAEALKLHLPAPQVAFFSELFGMLLDGHNSLLADGVQRALGRAPRDFSEYVQRAFESGAWGGA